MESQVVDALTPQLLAVFALAFHRQLVMTSKGRLMAQDGEYRGPAILQQTMFLGEDGLAVAVAKGR